ncbi:siderophore-interacting protein [Comamonas sp.]|uniref:siderophore-interacting protein n=1 Tax=Comamonas sp. TaxID=34028 RepID=UPI002899BA2E|nr:siderophore-interacting protein [Comamonas sp.]
MPSTLQVLSLASPSAGYRRIRFAGAQLAPFCQHDNIHCRLVFPSPQRDGASSTRVYTVRAFDADAQWLEIDFLLHADAGPGACWAQQAQVGDRVEILKPGGRTARIADWMVLAGDDSALPALARIAEQLPASTRGHVVCEIADPQDAIDIRLPPGMQWHWLYRADTPAGTGEQLQQAVQALDWSAAPPTAGTSRFLWVGAEFATAQALRAWAVDSLGLGKQEQLIVAYWRRGMSENELRAPKLDLEKT